MLTRLKSPEAAARWLSEWVTGTLRTDSRLVRPGDAFIAWPGYAVDGRRFVADALAKGAATCVVEEQGVEAYGFVDARVASLPNLKAVTGRIADGFFKQPTAALKVVATTGGVLHLHGRIGKRFTDERLDLSTIHRTLSRSSGDNIDVGRLQQGRRPACFRRCRPA